MYVKIPLDLFNSNLFGEKKRDIPSLLLYCYLRFCGYDEVLVTNSKLKDILGICVHDIIDSLHFLEVNGAIERKRKTYYDEKLQGYDSRRAIVLNKDSEFYKTASGKYFSYDTSLRTDLKLNHTSVFLIGLLRSQLKYCGNAKITMKRKDWNAVFRASHVHVNQTFALLIELGLITETRTEEGFEVSLCMEEEVKEVTPVVEMVGKLRNTGRLVGLANILNMDKIRTVFRNWFNALLKSTSEFKDRIIIDIRRGNECRQVYTGIGA